jgi:hypothetical protein
MTDAEVETIASEQKVAKRQGDESSLRIVSGSWKIGMRYWEGGMAGRNYFIIWTGSNNLESLS